MDDLADLLQDKFESRQYQNQQDKKQRRQQQQQQGQDYTFEQIQNILNPEARLTQQLEGNVLINWAGSKRFYTFDNHSVEALPQQLRQLAQLLKNGKSFRYQKMYNQQSITIGLPTATGLPFVYTLNTPSLISVHGKVRVHAQPEEQNKQGPMRIPEAIEASTDLEVTYSTRTQAKISFLTPFDHQRYIAGHDRNVQIHLPVRAEIKLDAQKRHFKIQLKPLQQDKEYKIFHYSTWPYVSQHDILDFKPVAEDRNTHAIQVRQPHQFEQQYGEKSTGIVIRLKGETQKKYVDFKAMYETALRHSPISALLYPTAEQTIEHTQIDLYFDAQRSSAQSVILTGSYEQWQPQQQQQQQEQYQEQQQQDQYKKNRAAPSSQSIDSQERRHEFLNRAQAGIKDSSAYVIDLGLEIQGNRQSKYVATVAYASSQIDEQSRLLTYLRKTFDNKNYEVCLDASSRMPNMPLVNYKKALETEPKAQVQAQLNFGEQCQSGSQVHLQGKFERSQQRKEYLQRHPMMQQAQREMQQGNYLQPAQQKIVKDAGVLDQYQFSMKYDNIPESIKNMTYQVYSVMRHLGYPYMSENPIKNENQQNKIDLQVNFAPDLKSVDVAVKAPVGDARFHNIRLNRYVSQALAIHPMSSAAQRVASAALGAQYDGKLHVSHISALCFVPSIQQDIKKILCLQLPAPSKRTWSELSTTKAIPSNSAKFGTC